MMYKRRLYLFYLIFFLFSFNVFAQGSESGVITELSGTVELKVSVASPFVPANVGDLVEEDTIISTGFSSSALIELGSVILLVRPLTRLTFTEIRSFEGTESLNVNLQAGRLRVDIDPPAGTRTSVDVISPMAVSSVRGTSFEFDARTLQVYSGTVSFLGSAGQRVSISAGSRIELGENGRAQNPVVAGSSAFRPSPPSGMQPNAAPALTAVIISERPGSGQNPGTDPGGSGSSDSGDAGFDFSW